MSKRIFSEVDENSAYKVEGSFASSRCSNSTNSATDGGHTGASTTSSGKVKNITMHENVQRAKQELWVKLHGNSHSKQALGLSYLNRVEEDIRSRLDLAFQQKMSTSLLVIGPSGSGKKAIIDGVLESYTRNHHRDSNTESCTSSPSTGTSFSVARIQGQVCSSDQDALCSIAGQLCLRPTTGRDLSTALEDLEDHFRQCALNGRPAVIVLQDVHAFATREKQVLIYTLLDYMHKSDMLFVVIGCTPCAHLQYMLEKRVLSRLNAQFVYVPPATGEDVCDVLARRLTLNLIGGSTEQAYRKQFNAKIRALFGVGDDSICGRGKGTTKKRAFSRSSSEPEPELLRVIQGYAEWGKGLSHFLRVTHLVTCRLTQEEPYMHGSTFIDALSGQDPYTLTERLSALPLHELHLFGCIARLHGRLGKERSSLSGSRASSTKAPSAAVHVDEVLQELDRLTGAFRRNESTRSRAFLGLISLVQVGLITLCGGAGKSVAARLVTDQTLVALQPPMYEILAAFHPNIDSQEIGRKRSPLVLSDRVRRAVLEPLVAVATIIESNAGGGGLLY